MSSPPLHFCSDTTAAHDPTSLALRMGAAGGIIVVSFLASSFPTLAKRSPRIEPPLIVFFVGKHFGTGVILSTAFVHLLQEGFENLLDPCLPGGWKNWTGFIVLLSFLLIFLIEYISTVYVEYLSAAEIEVARTRLATQHGHHASSSYHDDLDNETSPLVGPQSNGSANPSYVMNVEEISDAASSRHHARSMARRKGSSFRWHHRHESPNSHTHQAGPRLSNRQSIVSVFLEDHEETISSIPSPLEPEHSHEPETLYGGHSHGGHSHGGHSHGGHSHGGHSHGGHTHALGAVSQGEVSRRTRIIGILVLQMGIMLHSVVIGITLSITAGSKFTSLLVAIIFHQVFEGLSLGIRIASLPPGGRAARVLPVVLCVLFSIAAPVGIFLGIWLLPSMSPTIKSDILFEVLGDHAGRSRTAQLSKGLMCTISAGMLIYAAAVEMLAGDFVMDPKMRSNGLGMQLLALGSLIVGVFAMAILG